MNSRKKVALLLVALIATLGLAACGGSDSSEDTVSGSFERLPGAPDSYANMSGEAELTRSDGGTTTTISLDGLVPNSEYMAHLHTGGCEGADPGGPHFKFDPAGSEEPPNEIHLSFTSNGDGSGEAEASSDEEVPEGEAGSVVLHLAGHEKMASLFVHEGVDHSKEGGGHGDGSDAKPPTGHEEQDHGGGEAEETSDKIACANLEAGETEAAADAGAVPTIEVRNDEPLGGIQELEFSAGDEIRFKVSSDVAEEIHVHGYDIAKDVPANGSVVFSFPADIEGIFEVELEGLGTQIAELRVNP
jgi:Cu-Zn family superoxide dismutase